jgi:hypothetical protein
MGINYLNEFKQAIKDSTKYDNMVNLYDKLLTDDFIVHGHTENKTQEQKKYSSWLLWFYAHYYYILSQNKEFPLKKNQKEFLEKLFNLASKHRIAIIGNKIV